MKSGKLNNIITIEKLNTTINEYGEEISNHYTEKLRTRCDVVNDGGNRVNENSEIVYTYQKTFILWDYYDKILNEFDRIIYKGKPYRIITKDLVKEDKLLYVKTELMNE